MSPAYKILAAILKGTLLATISAWAVFNLLSFLHEMGQKSGTDKTQTPKKTAVEILKPQKR